MKQVFLWILFSSFIFADYFYDKHNQRELTPSPLRATGNIIYYKLDNLDVAIKDSFFIVLEQGIILDDILKDYPIKLKKRYNNSYLIKNLSNKTTLDITNQLYQDKRIKYAYPNFNRKINFR